MLKVSLYACVAFTSYSAAAAAAGNFGTHRSRYAAYEYDLTTPQYTPDGRLLQVEYALNACRRPESSPIVSVGLCTPEKIFYRRRKLLQQEDQNNDDHVSEELGQGGDSLLIMATISSPPPSSSVDDSQVSNDELHSKYESDKEQPIIESSNTSLSSTNNLRTQRRIIEIPLSTSFQTQHTTTTTAESTILIGLSGILADATSLLQIAYSILEEEQISYGWHRLGLSPVGTTLPVHHNNADDDSMAKLTTRVHHPQQQQTTAAQPSETAVRLARAIGDKCQKHAFGGGLRPLGASLLVAGIDVQMMNEQQKLSQQSKSIKLAICETEPSGAVTVINPFWLTTRGDGDDNDDFFIKPPQVMVSGGSIQTQSKLKKVVVSRLCDMYHDIISTESEKKGNAFYHEEVFLRRALQTVVDSLVEEWKGRGSTSVFSSVSEERKQVMALPRMEVVFTSSRRGTFRLTDEDIKTLMETAK
jgi:hypothetical protein